MNITLPAAWYHDPLTYERERRAIFGREWLVVGHVGEVAASGQYVTADIAGWSLVIVRDSGGVLRAFHNVCRHRAGPLVHDGAGAANSFVCRYHGWAYDLDGHLRSARDFGDAADLDVERCALVAIRAEEWRGLVFVNLSENPPPLVDSLGSFADACATFPMEEFVHTGGAEHDLAANWKTYADNYLEGYHIPLVHRELNKEVDAARYRVIVNADDRWCRHEVPTRDGAVNAGRWLWRWPNLALNLYADGMNIERFLPLGPTRTRVSYRYFFRHGRDNPAAVKMSTMLIEEDRRICEAVQRNLESGAYETGVLSPKHEGALAAFQGWVREALA